MPANINARVRSQKQRVFSSLGFTLIELLTAKRQGRRNKGFTLIELLIVMAVLAALATAVLVAIGPANQQRSRDTIRRSDLKQYQTALEVFANTNNGFYPNGPATVGALCTALGLTGAACKNDPDTSANYYVNSTAAAYELGATLEYEPSGTTNYYVVCSNGLSGDTTTNPSGAGCSL